MIVHLLCFSRWSTTRWSSVRWFSGQTPLLQFFAEPAIFLRDDLKKRINRITAFWRNGYFGKIDNHPVYIVPTKLDVLPKTFFQIILAAK